MSQGRTGSWRRGLVLLAALAGMATTAGLGLWQLDRAAQKEALQAHVQVQRQRPPLDAGELQALAHAGAEATVRLQPELQRPVVLRGLWLSAHTVYLDNRQMQGRPGFYVLTPFALEGTDLTVMVQRGWAPRDFMDRTRLPEVTTPPGLVELSGRLVEGPSRMLELGGQGLQEPGASAIRQNLDFAAYAAQTGLALAPFTVLQTGPASDGLRRDWSEPDAGTGKHYGYAFQWFGLCGLLAILYVWFQIIVPWRGRQRGGSHA